MLKAILAVARSIAAANDRWRARSASRRPMRVEIAVLRERVEGLCQENDLLRARLRRVAPRKRPHFRRHERLAILWHAERHGLSVEKTAKTFVVSVPALLSWRRDARSDEPQVVAAKPPVNKLPELVAHVAQRLKKEWPRWGTRRIAGVLARLGISASRTTVQTLLRRRTRPTPEPATKWPVQRTIRAKEPGHIWMIDFTRVGGFLRSVVVGAVIDAYSRKVLAIGVAPHEPTAAFAVGLLRRAAREHGTPKWLVSDHGKQLTAKSFGRALDRLTVRHRFGAIHRSGSLALIERFWKSLKEEYARGLVLYRPLSSIERSLSGYVRWFNEHRPHQGMDQRTPDETHYARSTRATSVPLRAVLAVAAVAGDRQLPVLALRPAA